MEKDIIERKLDEADLQAKNNKNHLTHEEVFSDIHKHLTEQQFNIAKQDLADEINFILNNENPPGLYS